MNQVAIKKDIKEEHELSVIEQVVMQGDLSKLDPTQRVTYYHKVCESLGLNPFTKPFEYISLQGKLTLYAKKDATEQLRKVNKISITELEGKLVDDLYIVTAKASTPDGRIDQATGAVTLGNLKGDARANAIMKAETKAKRRVTLSISGMGWTDECEIENIPNAKTIDVDVVTGEIKSEIISKQQADKLVEVLGECEEKYRKQVLDFIKKPPLNAQTIYDLPADVYEKVFSAACKKSVEAAQKKASEVTTIEIKEEMTA